MKFISNEKQFNKYIEYLTEDGDCIESGAIPKSYPLMVVANYNSDAMGVMQQWEFRFYYMNDPAILDLIRYIEENIQG